MRENGNHAKIVPGGFNPRHDQITVIGIRPIQLEDLIVLISQRTSAGTNLFVNTIMSTIPDSNLAFVSDISVGIPFVPKDRKIARMNSFLEADHNRFLSCHTSEFVTLKIV